MSAHLARAHVYLNATCDLPRVHHVVMEVDPRGVAIPLVLGR